jgi:PhnB protein
MALKKKATKAKSPVRKAAAKVKQAAKKLTRRAQPVPKGYTTVTPHLVIRGAGEAIEFYKKAFGAKDRGRMPGADGRLMHAEIQVGDARVMLSDEFPEFGSRGPQTLGGSHGGLMLYVRDCDAWFARAVAAGATPLMPVADQFWGDRYGKVQDPFGHTWAIATHKEDLSPKQLAKRAAEFAAAMGG